MSKAKVTSLEDWGIGGDENEEDDKKNLSKIKEEDEGTTSSKKNNKKKGESVSPKKKSNKEKDKESEKSKSKKKIKFKEKKREDEDGLGEEQNDDEEKKQKNNTYKELYKHMKNLQPDASKSIKKKTYELIKNFVEENDLDDDCYDLLIKGEDKKDILGICELISKKTRTG